MAIQTLDNNIDGNDNTAVGLEALSSNGITGQSGGFNTAIGSFALLNNTTASNETAIGGGALQSNTTGESNTAVGVNALEDNTTVHENTAIGGAALIHSAGNDNIALGFIAGANLTAGDNNIFICHQGVATESNTIRIGDPAIHTDTYIAGISGATASGGVAVFVNSDGKLGTNNSSKRFKENIQPMDKVSEAVFALKPVTFHYKRELDPNSIPQFGLVAEDVEKVNPDLVARDRDGKPYTVRYEAVNAMLLNEFLKEHRKVEQQESKMEQQEAKIARQQQQIEALTAGLQKVSAQLELSKFAPQVVSNQ
jgi:hypothetical protein